MERIYRTLFVVCLLMVGASAEAAKYRIERMYPHGGPVLGDTSVIQFSLYRVGEPNPLTAADLDLEHEKLIHMMMIDSGFLEYQHVHPEEVSPGVWQIPVKITVAGDYRFFLQFRPDGELLAKLVTFDDRYVTSPQQVVAGAPVHSEQQVVFKDGEFKVTVNFMDGDLTQKKVGRVYFVIEKNGVVIPTADLDNYLGVKMHIAAISADKKDFVHAHPGEHKVVSDASPTPGEITKIYFQQSGYYGLFMQFQYKGVVHTNQFAVQVKPSAARSH